MQLALGGSLIRDHRRLAAIVSLDVAGYSRLMGVDDSGTLAALKAHRRELIDPKITEHDGRIVKTTGDGLLLEFSSVVDAVRCAVDVQRGMGERNEGVAPDKRLDFRIGINVGDIIIDGDDIFGDGVNVAARLESLADPGGICVSRVVRDQVLDKLSFAFEDLGAQEVKNIVRPVEVYRVAMDSASPAPTLPTRRQNVARVAAWHSSTARLLVGAVVAIGLAIVAWTGSRAILRPAAVAPYSIEDRRMTFAVFPFQAPADDKAAAAVATAMTDAAFAVQEGKILWAKVAPRRSVEQALMKHTASKDLASDLDVHFLLRGNVSRAAAGYTTELLLIDAARERVIDTKSLTIPTGALTPRRREDLETALGWLTYQALKMEVERARDKPSEALDVRDLSFRAYVDWGNHPQQDGKGAYTVATELLNRALTLAPDDGLALFLTARVNLCDCVDAWSRNVEEQQAIGAAALEKYLQRNPESLSALSMKSQLYMLHGRFEESLLIADSMLKRDPEYSEALAIKAYDLLKLGRPQEALPVVNELRDGRDAPEYIALAAATNYELARYDLAAQLAQEAKTKLNREQLSNRRWGAVSLTAVAAEARLGHLPRARVALSDFDAAVPGVRTISAIRKWIHPLADLAEYEPLFDGLRLAGIGD